MLQISTSSTIEILLVIQQGLPLGEPPIKTLLSPYLSRISVAEVSSHVKFEKKKKTEKFHVQSEILPRRCRRYEVYTH